MSDADRISRLERQVEMLLAKVQALTEINAKQAAEIEDLKRRLGENSSNSNKPPSSDSPSDREQRQKAPPSGRAPGGQPGHKPKKRELVPSDKVTTTTDCFPVSCRRCGENLPKRRDPDPVRHQVIEIPEIRPEVHEFRQHRVTCECGAETCGALPLGTPSGILGARLLALVAMLTGVMHVSRRKVQQLLSDLLGIEVSLGCLSESEEVVSDAVASAVDEARVHALAARSKNVDATTWYQAGAYRAVWVMATKLVTVFYVAADGTREELQKWLSRVRGILISDRGTQFGFWAIERRQICWAHLLRKFASFATRKGRAGEIGDQLVLWSGFAMSDWHRFRDGEITRAEFQRSIASMRIAVENLLEKGALVSGIAGSCADILKHRDALWTFVDHGGIEPTNNHAERELRDIVIWRKLTFGSRSDRGTLFVANIKSVVRTCQKQRRHVFAYLVQAINSALRGRRAPSLVEAP